MEDLIKALQIFAIYTQTDRPTSCGDDTLYIMGVSKEEMSAEHIQAVTDLGFIWDVYNGAWVSFRFGSA